MSNELWELVGILIGDGNLWTKESKFRIDVTGDLIKDRHFIEKNVRRLLLKFTTNKIRIRERSNALRLRVVDKKLFIKLTQLGLKSGYDKINNLKFLEDLPLNKRRFVLRGLMDTDGTVVLRSNKQVFAEIATKSEFLSSWIKGSLTQLGFRSFVTKYTNKNGKVIFRVVISGKENLDKWINLIGFSNVVKFNKAQEILSSMGQSMGQ